MSSYSRQKAAVTDEYDGLRIKWEESITGGTGYDPVDPDYAGVIALITASAQTNWSSLNKTAGRAYLWSDLQGTTSSSQITEAYARLRTMALSYRTLGSGLAGDATLRADTASALDWMYANRYNQNKVAYDNWWDWQIGAPLQLNDATVLLYDSLTTQQRANYMAAVDHFSPSVVSAGANRVWKAIIVGVRGVIVKDGAKIANARDGLSGVLGYVTSSDGFYTDGSYIQHSRHPYTGGYGASLLQDIANLVYLLNGSTWLVTDPNLAHIYRWVYDSFEPLMYKGSMMDLSMGRVVARYNFQNHVIGHQVIRSVIRMSQLAPPVDVLAFKRMAKEWILADTALSFYADASMNMAILGKSIVDDAGIPPRGALTKNTQFNNMARAVHQRPGFAFGVSMHSSRIFNYESINGENLRGWHTSDGMTYLYNADLAQFSDAFWPTVNSTRLPGTTVEKDTTVPQGRTSDQLWVGGTQLLGYGVSGMAIHTPGQTLVGRKSWFMFDEEIVALGAGISATATDNKDVETVVENRKLNTAGDNVLTVDGTAKPTSIPWSETMTGVRWAHLAGSVPGSDIGYYFPSLQAIKGLREARTDAWSSIDSHQPFVSTTPYTRRYLNLWLDHGVNPTNAGYSYVLLPNKTAAQVADYSSNPDITIVQNNTLGQGVRQRTLKLAAANIWVDGGVQVGDIWSSKKSAVLMRESVAGIDVSVSDPMFINTGTFTVEISKAGGAVTSKDPAITVTQLVPTIKLTVSAAGLNGRSVGVSLAAPVMYSKAGVV